MVSTANNNRMATHPSRLEVKISIQSIRRRLGVIGVVVVCALPWVFSGCKSNPPTEQATTPAATADKNGSRTPSSSSRARPSRTPTTVAAVSSEQAFRTDAELNVAKAKIAAGEFYGSEHIVQAARAGKLNLSLGLIDELKFDVRANGCALIEPSALGANRDQRDPMKDAALRVDILKGLQERGLNFASCSVPDLYEKLAPRPQAAPIIDVLHSVGLKGDLSAALRACWSQVVYNNVDNVQALLRAGANPNNPRLELLSLPWHRDGAYILVKAIGFVMDKGWKPSSAEIAWLNEAATKRSDQKQVFGKDVLAYLNSRDSNFKASQNAAVRSKELADWMDKAYHGVTDKDLSVAERVGFLVRGGSALVDGQGNISCSLTAQRIVNKGFTEALAALLSTGTSSASGCVGALRTTQVPGLLDVAAGRAFYCVDRRVSCRDPIDMVKLLLEAGYQPPLNDPSAALVNLANAGRGDIASLLIQSGKADPVIVVRNPRLEESVVSRIAAASGERQAEVMRAWTTERDRIVAERREASRKAEERERQADQKYDARVAAARNALQKISLGDTVYHEYARGEFLRLEVDQVSGNRAQCRIVYRCFYSMGNIHGGEARCARDSSLPGRYRYDELRWFDKGDLLKWQP